LLLLLLLLPPPLPSLLLLVLIGSSLPKILPIKYEGRKKQKENISGGVSVALAYILRYKYINKTTQKEYRHG